MTGVGDEGDDAFDALAGKLSTIESSNESALMALLVEDMVMVWLKTCSMVCSCRRKR